MTFEEYQKRCLETAHYPNIGERFVYPTIGLAGETGEVVEKIKKVLRDEKGAVSESNRQEIAKELGDVLWYVSQIATELKLSLDEIAIQNIEKLASRAERNVISGSGDVR